jgi:hypothetical protein
MPFVNPKRKASVLISGVTGMGKTQSLLTFPGPRLVLVYPGEGGSGTLPKDDPDTTVLEYEDGSALNVSSLNIINEVEATTAKLVKTPGLQTFCGDGLHKLMAYVMDAMSGGAFFEGFKIKTESQADSDVLDPRVWGQAERWMWGYLNMVRQSSVPYVVMTSWAQEKQERKTKRGEKWTDVPTKQLPAMYGAMSLTVSGEFTVAVRAKRTRLKATDPQESFVWQTQNDGEVLGCSVKAPLSVVAGIPKYVPQDWAQLATLLHVGASNGQGAHNGA